MKNSSEFNYLIVNAYEAVFDSVAHLGVAHLSVPQGEFSYLGALRVPFK